MRHPAFLLATPLLAGCASIVSRSEWPVRFEAPTPTQFEVADENGRVWFEGLTPRVVFLPSGDGWSDPMSYSVRAGGTVVEFSGSLNPWYFGNLVFGGLVGILVVDPLTGAMWTLPENVDVGAPSLD